LSKFGRTKPRSVAVSMAIQIDGPVAATAPGKIDKSVLTISEPRRLRDKAHIKFVGAQPCLICARSPADAHHLRFTQPRAMGLKVSDEFTVPLCRTHLLDAVQQRLDANPFAMRIRRETVEHPFGTMKARMGATHFLTKTLPKVAAEMALSVLAYNLTRVINIVGIKPLMAAIAA